MTESAQAISQRMLLAQHDIFCLPGTAVEMPGYFRISLTANDALIDRALPGFAAAFERAASRPQP
jgi:aspartate aminotransferase